MHRSAWIRRCRLNDLLPSNTPFQIVGGFVCILYRPISDTSGMRKRRDRPRAYRPVNPHPEAPGLDAADLMVCCRLIPPFRS
ncbi:hypothetical protein CEXT_630581 [Caerostris extrusa]|uniref:Ycf15 n=1 Tax=Caerostris extrusa TaxID=172846 RepID=A0AAV4SDD7_CAEEX|nr:hypothetical protein CEXT_630581 [Caerostris extrusa]